MGIIVSIVTNNWVFNPTKRLFSFFNEFFGVALLTFGFLTFSEFVLDSSWFTKLVSVWMVYGFL